jgi:GTP-sensing pleiotropic transcriptional regulator CodY
LNEDKNIKVARLIGLEKKVREARTEDELYFVIANETRQIIDYVNSFLLLKTPTDKFKIKATSDLATVDRTSPLLTFVENFVNNDKTIDTKEIQNLDVEKLAKNIKAEKPKNLPENILFIPIISPQRGLQGYLLLGRQKQFTDSDTELVRHLSVSYGHAFNSFLKDISINNYFKKYFKEKNPGKFIYQYLLYLFYR